MPQEERKFPEHIVRAKEAASAARTQAQTGPIRRTIQAMPPLAAAAPMTGAMQASMQAAQQNAQHFNTQAQLGADAAAVLDQVPTGRVSARHASQQAQAASPLEVPQRQTPVQPMQPPMAQRPVAQHAHTIANPDTQYYQPVIDPEGTSISLPSRFAFYDFKDLYVRPFRGRQLSKIARAHKEQSLQPLLEAVSDVLRSTGAAPDRALAYELTVADFYAVLYWLRQNSFSKSNYIHTTYCSNPAHLQAVREGQKSEESLKVQELVRISELQIIDLEQMPDPEYFQVEFRGMMWPLRPATMRDSMEYTDHPRFGEADFEWSAGKACFIGSPDGGYTPLEDRLHVIDDLSADDIGKIEAYEALMDGYGVTEKVRVRCKECGASWVSDLILDAHSFLSANEHARDSGS